MPYWTDKLPSASNLRLFEPAQGWRAYDEQKNNQGQVIAQGCGRVVEGLLLQALNTTNLIVLTGLGSSFSAKNPAANQQAKQAPTMPDLWNAVITHVTQARFDQVINLLPKAENIRTLADIEKLLTHCKLFLELNDGPDAIKSFVKDAEEAILRSVDFVTDKTDLNSHRSVLRKIARRGIRKPRTKFFTTNYDLCFEEAARALRFIAVDGFSHSLPQVYDRSHFSLDIVRREAGNEGPNYVENVFHLYKLHGSLDWRRVNNEIVRSKTEGAPVLIYPRNSKYQEAFESPYLDMLGAFQAALREPDTALIIVGFGFNDDHIGRPIFSAIEANISLRVVICDIAFCRDQELEAGEQLIASNVQPRTKNPYMDNLRRLASIGDQRIAIINGRFEDLAHALPDLVAQTERERHAERMRLLRLPVEE